MCVFSWLFWMDLDVFPEYWICKFSEWRGASICPFKYLSRVQPVSWCWPGSGRDWRSEEKVIPAPSRAQSLAQTPLACPSCPSCLGRALWLRALGLNTGSGHERLHQGRTFYLNFIEIVLIVCCCEVAICVLMTRKHAEVNCIDCGSNRI